MQSQQQAKKSNVEDPNISHVHVYIRESHYRMGLVRRETFSTRKEADEYAKSQSVKCHIVEVRNDGDERSREN